MKKIIFFLNFLPIVLAAQAPAGYYNGTSGLTGYALKSKLNELIAKNYNWHYGDLSNYYNQTDLDKYYDHDATNTTILLDIYSEIPNGPDNYEYTTANMVGSANAEGLGWNREHMMPQSTYYGNYPMYSDLHYVIPTDARINQLRNIYPYGIGGNTNFYNFSNTSRIANSAIPNYSYTGRVYEPIPEFRGDIARSLLYFAVRYEGKFGGFKFVNSTSTNPNATNDQCPLDGTEERAYDAPYIAMLLQWHNADPVSQREIDRNNAVFAIQKNRNPFIDNPSWVNDIWGQTISTTTPNAPTNLNVSQTSSNFVTLNWSASTSADVIGYKIFQNGTEVASTRNTNISIDRLLPSTAYSYTVKAYNNGYMQSTDSNTLAINTISTDGFAKDLYFSKYLEGTGNNKALEITNKTGHAVNLNNYKLATQLYGNGNYYYSDLFELDGIIENNQSIVVMNPEANFTCYTPSQARFVTASPALSFTGSQFVELRYKSEAVDVIGVKGQSNSMANMSLYRKSTINQPNLVYDIAEWDSFPTNYCSDLGTLSTKETTYTYNNPVKVYPNPVVTDKLFVKGKDMQEIKSAKVIDNLGRIVYAEEAPFRDKDYLDLSQLENGVYYLLVDSKSIKIIVSK